MSNARHGQCCAVAASARAPQPVAGCRFPEISVQAKTLHSYGENAMSTVTVNNGQTWKVPSGVTDNADVVNNGGTLNVFSGGTSPPHWRRPA
jgi:autotransporter passenger strand-loop-strand repeat protein